MKLKLIKKDKDLTEEFLRLKDRSDVARLLEIDEKTLIFLIYRNKEHNYKKFSVKKKSGGERIINAPISTLKILQRKLNYILNLIYEPKLSVYGFCQDKNIVKNAAAHIKGKNVFNIDLKDFFPSINFGRVRGMLMSHPYNLHERAATILAQICCHNGQLPQGAPTSPTISNMICRRLDNQLYKLSKRSNCSYTRYGDDITLSNTRKNFPENIVDLQSIRPEVGEKLKSIINSNGFEINTNKVRLYRKTNRQEVTGLTVNEKVNIRRNYIRQVRAMLHAWEKYGHEAAEKVFYKKYDKKQRSPKFLPSFAKIIEGKIAFIKMVKGDRDIIYRKLLNKYRYLSVSHLPQLPLNINEELESSLWVVKCGSKQGTAFMLKGYGLITCEHVIRCFIEEQEEIKVFRYNDFIPVLWKTATIIECDKKKDVVVLKINGEELNKLPALELCSKELGRGDKVTFAGFPKYNSGDKPLIYPDNKVVGIRQTDKGERIIINQTMVSGQSGSPALNKDNKVCGIVVTGAKNFYSADQVSDYGLIPSSSLCELLDTIPEYADWSEIPYSL